MHDYIIDLMNLLKPGIHSYFIINIFIRNTIHRMVSILQMTSYAEIYNTH